MQHVKRVAPWAVAVLILAATGCAGGNPNVTALKDRNAQLQRERQELEVKLASATSELNTTCQELETTISDIVTMRQAVNQYVRHLIRADLDQRRLDQELEEMRVDFERGQVSWSDMERYLEDYIECSIHTGLEHRVLEEVMQRTRQRVGQQAALGTQNLDDIVERMARLHGQIEALRKRLAETEPRPTDS